LRLYCSEQVDLSEVKGTGKDGRILKEDILLYLEERTKKGSGEYFLNFFGISVIQHAGVYSYSDAY
jgi:pyruvate/2-oxoglutarate dehydrogenase complex dihydrolipoamide acyltransferase (E2) component